MLSNKNTRRDFLKILGLGVTSQVLSGCLHSFDSNSPPPTSKTNILFIFSDDHTSQSISAYGSKINKTPNIDRIAADGAIFINNFCTNSICAPSRACILTGKHSHVNGQMTNDDRFDGSQQTFPKLLQKEGYQTALFGKWHLKSKPTGFHDWKILIGQGHYYNPVFLSSVGEEQYTGYVTDIVTEMGLEWLKNKRDKNKPFLLMCQHKATHRTWAPNLKHLNLYDDIDIPEPPTLFDDYSNRHPSLKNNEMEIANHLMYDYDLKISDSKRKDALGRAFKSPELKRMTPEQRKIWDAVYEPKNQAFLKANLSGKELVRWKYQRYIKDYLRCVASLDENIGRILDYLEKTGLADNTLIVYSSDQGFFLGEHGWYDKRWMYEESLSMPLLMKWSKMIKPGTKIEALTQNIDFAPTFLEVAKTSIPDDIQGESLVPLLEGNQNVDWREDVYYHYYEEGEHNVPKHEGVRNARYKLIHFYGIDQWELFDLEKDSNELKSVYNDLVYSDVVKKMKAKLRKLKIKYKVNLTNTEK